MGIKPYNYGGGTENAVGSAVPQRSGLKPFDYAEMQKRPQTTAPQPSTPDSGGVMDVVKKIPGTLMRPIRGVMDAMNRQSQRSDEAAYKLQLMTRGDSRADTTKKIQEFNNLAPEQKTQVVREQQAKAPVMRALNSETGKKVTGAIYNTTNDAGLKVDAAIRSMGDQTYDEAFKSLKAKSVDPTNNTWEKLRFGLETSGVQSAIGALLSVGASVATKNPMVGRAVAAGYFAPISAEGQRIEKGSVTSLGNIAVDTVGDTILSGLAETALKSVAASTAKGIAKNFAINFGKGFVVEGSTEVSQTFIKYANDYTSARTQAEKGAVVDNLVQYIKEGGMLNEFLVGGVSGGLITGGAGALGNTANPNLTSAFENNLKSGYMVMNENPGTNPAMLIKSIQNDIILQAQRAENSAESVKAIKALKPESYASYNDFANDAMAILSGQGVDPNFIPGEQLKKPQVSQNSTQENVGSETTVQEEIQSPFVEGQPVTFVDQEGTETGATVVAITPEGVVAQTSASPEPTVFPHGQYEVIPEAPAVTPPPTPRPPKAKNIPKPKVISTKEDPLPKPIAQQNWRIGYDKESDVWNKQALLRAIADAKSTPKEQADVLDRVVQLRKEIEIGELPNILWAISRNPSSSKETKKKALALRADIQKPSGMPSPAELPAKPATLKRSPELQQAIDEQKLLIEFAQSAIIANNGSKLGRFMATRGEFKGELPEEFSKQGDYTQWGFNTLDEARKGWKDYLAQKERLQELKAQLKEMRTPGYVLAERAKPAKITPMGKDEVYFSRMGEAQSIAPGDRVRITDKATGKTTESLVDRKMPDGAFSMVNPDVPLIPYLVTKERFDIELLEKGDGKSALKKGITFGELAAREKTEKLDDSTLLSKGSSITETLATEPAKDLDTLIQRIEQLNKFGQSKSILRKTGGLPKTAAGIFRRKRGDPTDRGRVHLRDEVVMTPKLYMATLAHELGHALEYTLTGSTNKDTWRVFGKNLPKEVTDKIHAELKAITIELEGEATVKADYGYYFMKTELLARFFEKMFVSGSNMGEIAPTAMEYIERSAMETPIVDEYLTAVEGKIDEGQRKHIFLRDMKQTYQRYLGARVGEIAWNNEVRYRAMKERAKVLVEKMITDKFKGITDTPEALFRAAEAIVVTKGEDISFGTRDFQYAKNKNEARDLLEAGYEQLREPNGRPVYEIINDVKYYRFARQRYSEAEGRRLFNALSPEGKLLIMDFTRAKEEAKDYFNREMIKDVHKINSNIEGWVHHYWDDGKKGGIGGDKLKNKIASAKKHREGSEGYVEDLQKAMQKAITELETTKAYNSFIKDHFAMVSEPIARGQDPKPGYVEVTGDVEKGGIGLDRDMRTIIIKDGKSIPLNRARYQMPEAVYQRYKMMREVAEEAGTAIRVLNSISRYWRVNILFHPGSSATNFISGSVQYSTKIMADFYTEVLTGDVTMPKTRRNLYSMITVLTPKGWQNAPDWVYGGDMSNFYGQFGRDKTPGIKALDTSVDAYADKALKVYGLVERYWKKVIATAENISDLKRLNMMTREGLQLPTDIEKEIIDMINKETDLYAYDYDNVPVWMENYQQNPLAQAFKPFLKYPYKYAKHVTEMLTQITDRTIPWQERTAKLLSLMTIMAIYAMVREERKKEQQTPEVGPDAPPQVSTRGRFFFGTDADGNEMFSRTAKYPIVNLTEAALQVADGNTSTAMQSFADMFGSVAPLGELAMATMGYRNEYQKFTPIEVIAGENLASFVPGTRILSDIARLFDPYKRKPETFMQGLGGVVPVPTSMPDIQAKLHGKPRTIQVPLEGDIKPQQGEGRKRTTTDMYLKNYSGDVLWGLLGGIYIQRIDPDVAKAFVTRDEENAIKKAKTDKKNAYKKELN